MSWMELVGPTAFAAALLLVPGLVIALAAGLRGFTSFALAPALSTTALSVGAVLGEFVGLPWGWWTPLLAAALMASFAWPIHRWLRGRVADAPTRGWRDDLPAWAAFALAFALFLRHLRNILDRPDAFSQTFDNVFHLSAIRYIVETGQASSLSVGAVTAPTSGSTTYPAAFHDAVSLVMLAGEPNIAIATNAILVAIVAIAWPLSCLALVRSFLRADWATALGTGVLVASLPAFPILLLDFGVLYPNLYGLALLPALLSLLVRGLGLGHGPGFDPRAHLVLLMAIPGMALAHPNTLMTLLVVTQPLLLTWAWRAVRADRAGHGPRRIAIVRVTVVLGTLAAGWLLWERVRPPEEAATWQPTGTVPDAVGQALLNAPFEARAAWLASALMIIGILVAPRLRLGWVVGAWGVLVVLWLFAAGAGFSPLRTFMVGIWYNDPPRLAAHLPLLAIPLAAIGLQETCARLTGLATRARPNAARWVAGGLAVLAPALLILGTQRAPYMDIAVDKASWLYHLGPDSPLVTSDEMALLERLDQHVAAGEVIATNPWNGSSMAYALTGHRTTTTHILFDERPEQAVVRDRLDEAADDPSVCAASEALGDIRWVLDFGTQEVHYAHNPYPGFDQLARSEGFDLVDSEGSVALYAMTACD